MPSDDLAHADHEDGCICDLHLHDHELLSDADLPPAWGAVESAAPAADDAPDADGRDDDTAVADPVSDADLPPAVGGVG